MKQQKMTALESMIHAGLLRNHQDVSFVSRHGDGESLRFKFKADGTLRTVKAKRSEMQTAYDAGQDAINHLLDNGALS